jgi:hypothetical protein
MAVPDPKHPWILEIKNMPRDPTRRGEFVELCFSMKATLEGFYVSKPLNPCLPYDFILDNGQRLLRVQVKGTFSKYQHAYHIRTRRGGDGTYHASELDVLAGFIVPLNVWYVFPAPVFCGKKMMAVYPHARRPSRSRNEPYREAWHLLR